ncbi:HAD family hydrolase [Gynuella sp.]|uniref:histidinol-phosphatase n=1 Tax=Gynuella sp. TaxID=2969146 RepID=UPI003D0DD388
MTLAIFDLDNTLLNGDSDHAWGEFLIARQLVNADQHQQQNDFFYEQYMAGTLDIFAYQEFVLSFLTQYDETALEQLHQEFMTASIEPIILPQGRQLLAQHREQGHFIMIITATNDFITGPIANMLEVDHLIATQAEKINGRYTGRITGTPSFQQGKVIRLQQWLDENGESLDGAYFYSDSHNDLPLLQQVSHPVAVDPDQTLATYAREHNWPVISLRD